MTSSFSFQRLLDPKTAAPYASNFGKDVKVEAVDPNTVRFTLPAPNAAFLALLAVPPSSVVSKKFVEGGNNLADAMMGTGPFKYQDRQPGVQLKLVRNDKYYVDGRPYLDGITFMFFPDETARVTALRTNAVDIMDFVPQAEQGTLEATKDVVLYTDKETNLFQFAMRQDRPPFENVKVRQALSCAVDREAALKASLFGRGAVLTGGPILEGELGVFARREADLHLRSRPGEEAPGRGRLPERLQDDHPLEHVVRDAPEHGRDRPVWPQSDRRGRRADPVRLPNRQAEDGREASSTSSSRRSSPPTPIPTSSGASSTATRCGGRT